MHTELTTELNLPDYSSEPLASARWADPEYIADKYAYVPGAIWLGRSPHNPDQAIGYKDDRHVFLNAETRSGKGRAFLVNNQILWPGSLITVGPKGEEATIAAIRRGRGNEYCEGMKQDVYVLDPMRCADVPEDLRAHFNLLKALDPKDGELVAKVDRVANAICTIPDASTGAGNAAEWAKEGKNYVANIILHVVTSRFIEKEERNVLKVRDLVLEGNVKGARMLEGHLAEQSADGTFEKVDPYMVLLQEMEKNPACNGAISRNARDMIQSARNHVKYFESVRKSASAHLRFLEGQGISNTVAPPTDTGGYHNTFEVADLKERRISVFLCLPEHDYEPLARWLRAMIEVLIGAMQARQGLPANGYPVLFCIDEFANLGKMESIARAQNSIAGAGVKLMIATQRLGDLQELYGKAWEKFISGAGVQIWFGAEEIATREYLEKKLGKTEVSKIARTIGKSTSDAVASGVSESYSHTNSLSRSETTGETSSTTEGRSRGTSRNVSRARGSSTNYGTSDGRSAGRNYGPHLFFEGPWHGTNYSSTSGRSRGGGRNQQRTVSKGVSDTFNRSETAGTSHSSTFQQGSSDTHQKGTSHTETSTDGQSAGLNESFHVKPLLSALEAKQFLISPEEPDHPAYPGLALITLAGEEHPFFVRKANYDQDPFFIGKFNPNPAYQFIPYDKQPLLGWQITPEHFLTVQVPADLRDATVYTEPALRKGRRIEKGETFLHVDDRYLGQNISHRATFDFKVIDLPDPQVGGEEDSAITIRADFPLDEEARKTVYSTLWDSLLEQQAKQSREEERRRQQRQATNKRLADLREEDRALQERKKSFEDRINELKEEERKAYLIAKIVMVLLPVLVVVMLLNDYIDHDFFDFVLSAFRAFIFGSIIFGITMLWQKGKIWFSTNGHDEAIAFIDKERRRLEEEIAEVERQSING